MSPRRDGGTVHKEDKHVFQHVKQVDLVVEVLDARLPRTSRNDRLYHALAGKSRLVLLNKADLADKTETGRWLSYLAEENGPVLAFSSKGLADLPRFEALLRKERPRQVKFKRPLRLMVVGIPNVGKSSVINRLAYKLAAKTGNTPGITRGAQWIRLRAGWEMLDTPGILSPQLDPEKLSPGLAVIGAVSPQFYDVETVALWLVSRLQEKKRYLDLLCKHYHLGAVPGDASLEQYLERIASSRGLLKRGGGASREKAAQLLLSDFRKGALGRITLEVPEDQDA